MASNDPVARRLTQSDLAQMETFGLDPNSQEDRKAWLANTDLRNEKPVAPSATARRADFRRMGADAVHRRATTATRRGATLGTRIQLL